MSPLYEFRVVKDETDDKKFRHRRYQLYFKNIKVEGVEYVLHDLSNRLESANGRIVEDLAVDVANPIQEQVALIAALADQKLTLASFKDLGLLPKGELVIAPVNQDFVKENFRLCYAFNVTPATNLGSYRIFVDATSGTIFRRLPLFANCSNEHNRTDLLRVTPDSPDTEPAVTTGTIAPLVTATFIPNYSRYLNGQSVLSFQTEQVGSVNQLSIQNTQLNTRIDERHTGIWADNREVQNPSLAWGGNAPNATTAHWLTQLIYQFYQNRYSYNGYDGNGTYPHVLVDLQRNDGFAQWDNTQNAIRFAFLNGQSMVTMDVVGHEYTHAVTQYGSNLVYAGESGAINESISDIFGTALERATLPNWNWTLGEDTQNIARDMSYPPAHNQPENYANLVPISPPCVFNNDFCNVHTNSGIMNKWFYALAAAIPFDDAAFLVYYTQRYFLTSNSNYHDVRDATWQVAANLYGTCSTVQARVAQSWRLVGLSIDDCPATCQFSLGSITANNPACNQTLTLSVNCIGNSQACDPSVYYVWNGPTPVAAGPSTVTTTAPASAGTYTYSVTGVKSQGCQSNTSTITINVACNPAQACNPVTSGNCYTLKVQKTGLRLQVMGDGSIQQQNANNQNNQIWQLDDTGGSTFRFTTQDGTGRAITSNSGNAGEWLSLSGYSGANGQKWYLQCNNTNNHYRVYRDNAVTWDVKDYGTSPQLQLFGTTSDNFFDYRSFEFQPTTCPAAAPPSGNFAVVAPAYNCQTGALTLQTSGGNGSVIEYQIAGLRGWDTNPNFTVPSYQANGTTFTLQARQSGIEAPAYQYTTACGGTAPPTGGALTVTAPTINCTDGNLTLNTSGGNGTAIEYQVAGLQAWSANNVLNVPTYQRNGTSFTIQARQSGVEANPFVYTTGCAGYRLAAVEDKPEEVFILMPNPTTGRVTVRFWLPTGQSAVLRTTSTAGVEIVSRAVVGTGKPQEELINLEREPAGVYLLTIQSDGKRLTGKVVLQR